MGPWFGHLHALQNLRQELKNEQSRSSEVSAKLEELEATQRKKQMRSSRVSFFSIQGVLRSFVFASFCGMLCISIKCFVQILSDEMNMKCTADMTKILVDLDL